MGGGVALNKVEFEPFLGVVHNFFILIKAFLNIYFFNTKGWVHNFFKSSNPFLNIYFLVSIKGLLLYI